MKRNLKNMFLSLVVLVFSFTSVVKAETVDYTGINRPEQSAGITVSQVKPTEEGSNEWEIFYNKETNRFEVIYTITDEAPDEIVVDLTNVYAILNACGKADFESWGVTQEQIDAYLASGKVTLSGGMDYGNNQSFLVYLDESFTTTATFLPGDRLYFNVTVRNESGKVYSYVEKSLVIATAKHEAENGETVEGFDGQIVPDKYTKDTMKIGYNLNLADTNVMNTLVDKALIYRPLLSSASVYLDAEGNVVSKAQSITFEVGTPVINTNAGYAIKLGNYYYGNIPATSVDANSMTLSTAFTTGTKKASAAKTRKNGSSSDITASVKAYLNAYYEGNIENYVLAYFNEKFETSYENINDLLNNESDAVNELAGTISRELARIEVKNNVLYNNYFERLFSIIIGDENTIEENETNNRDSWGTKDGSLTIGSYMKEEATDDESGKWYETDKFLNDKFNNLENESEESFIYGINVDGIGTGNSYMNFAWNWYSSITLVAQKGTVVVKYVDETGKELAESVTLNGYVGQSYTTEAAEIEGYVLIKTIGTETNLYSNEEAEVIYVYQFVMGEGGEDIPGLVQTGVEVDFSIMSSSLITLTLIGLVAYTKKRRN